ncbi:DNA helicase [Ranunculus cassubicifolius]
MPIYKIKGIDVDFPYEAYDCQIVYMEKVIQSLQERCNALLESPTGTGKTLCLLCATLAWRRSLGEFSTNGNCRKMGSSSQCDGLSSSQGEGKLPTIVYTTRTHSQLQQVIQELKRTNYRPKMVVIGSREQLCINDDVQVLHGRAQTNFCQFLRKKRKCKHFSKLTDFLKDNSTLGDDPIDIEDLVNIGRMQGPCPYYLSRELHKVVDILFAPYNYLIDPGNRKSLSVNWHNSVLIFDEAHNLESICSDAASFDLPSSLLTACVAEAKKCVDLAAKKRDIEKFNDKSADPNSFAILRALLLKLEKRIADVPIESKELGFTRPGPYIYELLAELNITQDTKNMLIDTITNGVTLLEDDENAKSSGSNKTKGTVNRLETLADIFNIVFSDGDKSHAKSYRVHVQEVEARAFDSLKGKASRTLSWWCFNPGIAMVEFAKLGVGSIILTSGTLSPLDSFAQELKLDFPVRLENPHVISSNQIWSGVVPVGPSGCSFNSSYKNRGSLAYKQDLGNAIANFARIVPDGLLVFFPSYYLLDQCIDCWKDMGHANSTSSSTIWERICKYKQPVVEPKQSSLFSSSIEDFMNKLKDKSTDGAVFFAVCRGKVSEGLDFADHTGRAVVVTGMPFATWNDPKVRLKRDYLDHQGNGEKKHIKALTGSEWYSQLASRAVNQAVGRVIRHRHDYGAIIFCDERFAQPNNQSQMSRWIQPYIKCYSNFGEVVFTLTRFFRDKVTTSVTAKPNLREDVKISLPQPKSLLMETITISDASPIDEACCKKSSSSITAASRTKTCCLLEEVTPANRSTLTPTLKHPKRELLERSNIPVIDLTSSKSDWPDDQLRTKEPKKFKTLKLDPDFFLPDMENGLISSSSSSRVQEKIFDSKSQLTKCTSAAKTDITKIVEVEAQKDCPSGSTPCTKEVKGGAFLGQVKEKLSPEEYLEFKEYLKAMQSKTMKMSDVLKSIARLFSSPDRTCLLQSFNDYLPAKLKPMYQQYLKNS